MKKINQLLVLMFFVSLGILCLLNVFLARINILEEGKEYQISFNRIQWGIEEFEQEKGRVTESLEELADFAGVKEYPYITGLWALEYGKEDHEFWSHGGKQYGVIASKYGYYKVFYVSRKLSNEPIIFWVNMIAGFFLLLMWSVLWYVRQKILVPFSHFSDLPYELSKGNLTLPLKESRDKFFGKFMWGMDVLRENLEENKARELQLQKEKKLLLLSLSHDIKTPLSAIHLYAQALCRNLYREEAKKLEIAKSIKEKAEEIEFYIGEIVKASHEEFLDFQVKNEEIYIGSILEQIREYYQEKMTLNQVELSIFPYSNCLVWGDGDRLVEVVQNVMENALKYGDGRRIQISAGREEEYMTGVQPEKSSFKSRFRVQQEERSSIQEKSETFLIVVRNTGCGLAQKELPHVFDSFFRGSNVGKNGGSGLGLYICRQLMHLMEGEIIAEIKESEGEAWMEMKIILRLA